AGAPEWETYMQLTGDAGLEVRVPVEAGPRVVGVSFVREMWEPEGLPQPQQRGRVITNDEVYMDYANVGSVQIGGPYPTPQSSPSPSPSASVPSPSRSPSPAPSVRAGFPSPGISAANAPPSRRAIFICQP